MEIRIFSTSLHTGPWVLREQVSRFQQHRFLPVAPSRYLEQLRRPKHKSLEEEEEETLLILNSNTTTRNPTKRPDVLQPNALFSKTNRHHRDGTEGPR